MTARFATGLIAALTLAVPVSASEPPTPEQQEAFSKAAGEFTACLVATVKIGMTTRMDPAAFKAGFALSCTDEQAAFRSTAVPVAMTTGLSREQAETEIDTNIANGRRIYASDQETYVSTGKVAQ